MAAKKKDRERFGPETRCYLCGKTVIDLVRDEVGRGWFVKLKDVGKNKRKWKCQFCDR